MTELISLYSLGISLKSFDPLKSQNRLFTWIKYLKRGYVSSVSLSQWDKILIQHGLNSHKRPPRLDIFSGCLREVQL